MRNETAPAVNVTEKQTAVLRAVVESEYRDGDPDLSRPVWSSDLTAEGVTSRGMGGVFASLSKKGLVVLSGSGKESTVELTPEGIAAVVALSLWAPPALPAPAPVAEPAPMPATEGCLGCGELDPVGVRVLGGNVVCDACGPSSPAPGSDLAALRELARETPAAVVLPHRFVSTPGGTASWSGGSRCGACGHLYDAAPHRIQPVRTMKKTPRDFGYEDGLAGRTTRLVRDPRTPAEYAYAYGQAAGSRAAYAARGEEPPGGWGYGRDEYRPEPWEPSAAPASRPDDRLSRLMSALDAAEREQHDAHADVDAHRAPSECHGLMSRGFGPRVLHLLREAGYPAVEDLEAALRERGVSARWLHFRGPSYALAAAEEEQDAEAARATRRAA